MLDRLARRLYERLGTHYKLAFFAVQIPAAVFVALSVVAGLASFYHPSPGQLAILALSAAGFTTLGVTYALTMYRLPLAGLMEWRALEHPTPEETTAAWKAATTMVMRTFRRNSLLTNSIAAIPSVVVMVLVLHLNVVAFFVLLAASSIAAAYGTVLTYSLGEMLMRPVIEEIAAELPDDFDFKRNGLLVRKRLMITLPIFAEMTGLAVAALVTHHGGTRTLAISVVAACGVGMLLSLELTALLSRAITMPLDDLRHALARVGEGDYDHRVPVVSSDDLGELSSSFNQMARGLSEREQIREAFGTYLDKDVAGFILSGNFPAGGVEVDVSLMFCDVQGFTSFAEQATATEVVSSLNGLFEVLVPIISRHGGHVDKFMGDGLLAVFGAPENFPDHADRAVAAGLEICAASTDLPVRVGINSGPVVAGSVGGAGRLNFSVIGDAVNTAARVEAATRETGDQLLLTRATSDALQRPIPLESRGSIPLKGKAEPVELLAAAGLQRPAEAVSASVSGG